MKYYFIILFLSTTFLFGQDNEIPAEDLKKMEFSGVYKSAISLELGGKSGLAGLSYDRLLSSHFRLGLGAGFKGIGLDFKYYPVHVQRDRWLFNIGLRANMVNIPGNILFCSMPLGVSHFGLSRINLDFDIGPLYKLPISDQYTSSTIESNWNYIWVSAKIGYRFSFYAMRRAHRLNKEAKNKSL